MSGPPVVDYTATSERPLWSALPEALRTALAVALGTEIAQAGPPVGSGFTGGFAAPLTLADGREVFVKAAHESQHPYTAYQREAELVPRLPSAIHVPQIESRDFPRRRPAQILAGQEPLPAGFQPWLPDRLQEIQELVDLYPTALAGDSAVHCDIRPDNLLIDQDNTCWTLDWNWLCLGPAWFDWVGLLPMVHRDGIDTFAALEASPLTSAVPAEDLDCYAATVAVYMLNKLDAPPPPGCTAELRRHQRLYAWAFLDWLAVRREWV